MESKYTFDYFEEKNNDIYDEMTGLYNRRYSLKCVQEYLDTRENVSLIVLDIDNFKSMNERFGRDFGDEVINKMAEILKDAATGRGLAARFGDDDFFLCVCDVESEQGLRSIIQSIYLYFKKAFMEKDHQLSITMGVAGYPNNTGNLEELIAKAEKARDIGKEKGKNRYIIYKEFIHGDSLS